MFFPDSFKISTPGDREVRVTRDFDAPRALVFDAFTKPELVRRWLLGPPGCETRRITTTTITILYESEEARDTARRSGMEYGMAAGYDRLEKLLPTVIAQCT